MAYYANAHPDQIEPQGDYNLDRLAEIFDCRPSTLRTAIQNEELKARKRGRTWIVKGRDALEWWESDGTHKTQLRSEV